jgi:NAD(P)-dependent dehydrogenase (short-subunit alcohol dehydrogenase family)
MGLLDGKVAVITGAGSGMAKASARVFVREGAQVVAADISGAEKDTAAELGDAVIPVHCDVTDEASVEAAIQAAVGQFGQLDAVLNVAGIAEPALIRDIGMDHYDRIMNVDLRGVVLGTKHGIRAMLTAKSGGSIVNWSSIGGLNSTMATGMYGAAKAGVISITKTAALEVAHKGIRVNCVCPGYVKTEGMSADLDNFPGAVDGTPMKRLGRPEEIAEVAAFLCSDRASFVSGAVIPIDGARSAGLV